MRGREEGWGAQMCESQESDKCGGGWMDGRSVEGSVGFYRCGTEVNPRWGP